MPVNVTPEYAKAEKAHLEAKTIEEKIETLQKLISEAPKHKGGENLRAQLRTRYKKLLEKQDKTKKSKRGGKTGIKKEDMQAVIIGKTNSGKSSLLNALTNNSPEIAEYEFTTKTPQIGMMKHSGVQIQVIENPAINSEYFDKGIINTADTILILINSLNDIQDIEPFLSKSIGKRIIIYNSKAKENLRKIEETLKSKKINFIFFNPKENQNKEEIKEKIFKSFDKIRIYTKEPGKEPKKERPLILEPDSTVKEVAEKILHGFSDKVKETKIWGPSSKFGGQIVGLNHKLKDLDVVEFKTK